MVTLLTSLDRLYTIDGNIATNKEGGIFTGFRKRDKARVVIKKIIKSALKSRYVKVPKGVMPMEALSLYQVRDLKDVVQVIDVCGDADNLIVYLVMNSFSGRQYDLERWLSESGPMESEYTVHQFFTRLLRVVLAIKARNIYHCDLKPGNVLISQQDEPGEDDVFTPTLIDFGSALDARRDIYPPWQWRGTTLYDQPEGFQKSYWNADSLTVWQLGVILFCLVEGRKPFTRAVDIENINVQYKNFRHVSPELRTLMKRMFSYCDTRPSLDELVLDPWFSMTVFPEVELTTGSNLYKYGNDARTKGLTPHYFSNFSH